MKPFYKIPSQGILTGVCAGISVYTGVPTIFVRIGFVCFSHFLLLPYILLAVFADKNDTN